MKVAKTTSVVAILLAMFGGMIMGGVDTTLRAQVKPPIYMIGNVAISNEEAYSKEYLPLARKSIQDHGGVYIAAGKGYAISGEPPKGRLVILRFESMDKLMEWINSPDYQAAHKVGEKYASFQRMAVDGVESK